MFCKKAILKNFVDLTGKHLCWKENSTQVFSCEICEMFKDAYFEEHLRTTASGVSHLELFQMGMKTMFKWKHYKHFAKLSNYLTF